MQEECLRVGEKDLAREKPANRAIYEVEDGMEKMCMITDTQGGLNMIHIHSFNIYLKLSMIKILLTNPEGKWQELFLTDLKQYGGERVLYSLKAFGILAINL
jgi:hypothetical protein